MFIFFENRGQLKMTQVDVIAKLSTLLPHWRRVVEKAENCTFDQLRQRIRSGQLLISATTRDALVSALDTLSNEAGDLAEQIESLALTPLPAKRVRVAYKTVERLCRAQFPDWGMWKQGLPARAVPWLAEQGLTFDHTIDSWVRNNS